ncbi:MAG TPA: VCBS repeat-containing protein, partial [Pyrinomonadaceae bacterium]|nr:VCBS repeat-containing protein [Pyrinomonadaceae bacterium]
MSPTTLFPTEKRFRLLKGLVAFALCSSFMLPQVFAPRAAKALSNPVPNSAPPEAFLLPSSSTVTTDLIGSLVTAGNSIRETINGPVLPEGFEMAKPPSFVERLGSTMASMIAVKTAPQPAPPPPAGSVTFDFDGDGKADIAKWRSANSEFKIQNSNGGSFSTYTLGSSGSKPAPADYDGDGKTDPAAFNSGTWTIRQSSNSQTVTITGFGQSGDIPVSGNYVGSSSADAAVYRPSNGTWYIRDTGTGTVTSTQFGATGDIAVPGNYDGGVMDPAVFRPSTGDWHILGSVSGYYGVHWGVASDIPVPADYDGDNLTDLAVYRGSTGTWYAYKSSAPGQYTTQTWGNYGDQPVPADYDHDGKADFSVWRPTTGVWHTLKSFDGGYVYTTLGAAGDTAVPSAYLKQIGGQVFGYDLAKARLSPKNATGGTDLYSRNFSWGKSLVGLPGRAGLDAGFGISYNSLVWTRTGNTLYFDTNNDNISPGFRFGFPTIEPVYYDSLTEKWNYMMVTPSGGRVEFRQTTVSDTYETADSSYLQLVTKGAASPNDPVEDISITVTSTDGTKMEYEWKGGEFRCKEIKDRNGNFISVNHDDQGLLRTVTDTLGRVITVEYDTALYP